METGRFLQGLSDPVWNVGGAVVCPGGRSPRAPVPVADLVHMGRRVVWRWADRVGDGRAEDVGTSSVSDQRDVLRAGVVQGRVYEGVPDGGRGRPGRWEGSSRAVGGIVPGGGRGRLGRW